MFQFSKDECESLRLQIETSKKSAMENLLDEKSSQKKGDERQII